MRLHILAGCRELLHPDVLAPEMVADLIGPHVRVPTAFWISEKCGNNYHSFLQDEPGDCRTRTMAMALRDGFGSRFEPLLILPNLLNEVNSHAHDTSPATTIARRSQISVLSEILACGHVRQLHLYGLALPAKADPEGSWAVPAGIVPGIVRDRIERLRNISIDDMGIDSVETRVVELTPDLPVFDTLYNNSICNHFVLRMSPRLRERGWTVDPEILAVTIFRILVNWNRNGIFPILPLRTDHLDSMSEVLYRRLL